MGMIDTKDGNYYLSYEVLSKFLVHISHALFEQYDVPDIQHSTIIGRLLTHSLKKGIIEPNIYLMLLNRIILNYKSGQWMNHFKTPNAIEEIVVGLPKRRGARM